MLLMCMKNVWSKPPLNPGTQRRLTDSHVLLIDARLVGGSGLSRKKERKTNIIFRRTNLIWCLFHDQYFMIMKI